MYIDYCGLFQVKIEVFQMEDGIPRHSTQKECCGRIIRNIGVKHDKVIIWTNRYNSSFWLGLPKLSI